jgi:flavodoxin/ferredoxin
MKVLLAYFSATGNTAQIANTVKEQLTELNIEIDEFNITSHSDRQNNIDVDPYDAAIFGFPVYSNRAPRLAREWLQTLDGNGKKCATFFTYGGLCVHPSHYSTRQILEKQNFVVVSSAEFLGAHTFNLAGWEAMENRPNQSNFDVAREYALKTYKRFIGEDAGRLGELEKTKFSEKQLDEKENFKFKIIKQFPTRNGKECSMCRTCEEQCPTHAMNAETGSANPDECIVCLRCVANCPDNILKINDLSKIFKMELQRGNTTKELLAEKTSKIYL